MNGPSAIEPLVRIIGHRGARGLLPENTLSGFRFCLETGVRWLELDILGSADGVPMVAHDPQIIGAKTRRADGQWLGGDTPRVADLTQAELRGLNIGALCPNSPEAAEFPDQASLSQAAIPTLEEVLALAQSHPGARFLIEFKSDPRDTALAASAHSTLEASIATIRAQGLAGEVCLQSFDWAILDAADQIAPDMARAYLSLSEHPDRRMFTAYAGSPWFGAARDDVDPTDLPGAIHARGGEVWSAYHQDLTRDQVRRAQDLGLLVYAWTVNTPGAIEAMLDLWVDGIITDYPGRAQRAVLNRGRIAC
ncbi:glycerophosphodiester phosphodiesterase family protein [Thalassovita taeanensis]|uniref:Glycerophosphoryl diester phosphodiesterase n=1 Tax=Thalassovita taeanensis TaxID=657014 RepID=A0A1H9J769_9RHOB|nr:glycerophosphodiester phosphodiesterase family protein [Thalassovita taeanensis]SEQ82636.1 glycerophosphoryl diester phosphodiesterase [Thalassovita taeanensis]